MKMEPFRLEKQAAEPLDDATIAALDVAETALERGEYVTLEEAQIKIKKRYQEWLKTREKVSV